tara:strand:- start:11857 stop:12549 length:693 start_codon:yes stop_codon:yes gene_type:complete
MTIDKIYYINLDRREDRNKHFLEQCEKHSIPQEMIERFSAIDGSTYNFSEEELNLFTMDVKRCRNNKALIGNQLSHYYIMKEMIEKEYSNILICQDDVVFCKQFLKNMNILGEYITNEFDIVNIGLHKMAIGKTSIPIELDNCRDYEAKMCSKAINGCIGVLRYSINPCSLAYVITLQGAKNYIEYFNKNKFNGPTDHCMNHYLMTRNIFYASRKILATGNPSLGSDIFT